MGFGWIRTANVFNRLVAFIAFTYFLFVDGLLHAAKFALVAVVLFVAIGASDRGERVHADAAYRTLAMDAYKFS